ncbi:MAG TPA: peptidyl-prolyl cis-trans isomerase, partial [bacterium]|nr:peptidyl-prolyl cis-trans isomerase [bacterium]
VEAFQTDGQFDKQKYLQALNNPAGNEWLTVENYIRASLPAKKLQSTVMASVTVHESEIRAEYRRNNIEYTVDYVHVPVSAVSDEEAQPSTQAIQNYYQNHIDEYRVPEQRTLQYVEFPKTPSQADSAAARDLATEALQRARSGEDFAELAREYSDGPSASEGGDLGWFGRGQMVPAFEEAAFDTPTGEVAGPVLSQFGYHVIHVRNRRTRDGEEQILASHILINIEVSPATIDNLNSQANLFLFDAQDYSFQSSADTHNVTIRETQPFGRDASFIPGLDPAGEATDFAFSNPVGTISDVIDVESGYYIFRLQNIREPYVRDLESVRSQISRQLITEKKRDLAFQQAQELRASLSDSSDLQQLTATGSLLTYSAPDPFTIAGTIPGVGQVPEFKGAVKALDVGQTSPAVKSDQGAYIIRLKDKTAFNQERYKQQRAQIRQRLLTRKQNRFMTRWLESLRTEANIVDNRDAFL